MGSRQFAVSTIQVGSILEANSQIWPTFRTTILAFANIYPFPTAQGVMHPLLNPPPPYPQYRQFQCHPQPLTPFTTLMLLQQQHHLVMLLLKHAPTLHLHWPYIKIQTALKNLLHATHLPKVISYNQQRKL